MKEQGGKYPKLNKTRLNPIIMIHNNNHYFIYLKLVVKKVVFTKKKWLT